MDLMRKADLLDELRADIGVVSDKLEREVYSLYRFVIQTLHEKVAGYRYVGIYLTSPGIFRCFSRAGNSLLSPVVRFGEGLFSLAAARGNVVREQVDGGTEVYVPFYRGHHLVGIFVVISDKPDSIDDEDIALFCELASLFETKVEGCNS